MGPHVSELRQRLGGYSLGPRQEAWDPSGLLSDPTGAKRKPEQGKRGKAGAPGARPWLLPPEGRVPALITTQLPHRAWGRPQRGLEDGPESPC